MELLSDDLRKRLPKIHGQEAEEDPMVYARYYLPGTRLAWFVMEGEPDGDDFIFFGFVPRNGDFRYFRLSELRAAKNLLGQPVECDPAFGEGRLTDVVPAPDE